MRDPAPYIAVILASVVLAVAGASFLYSPTPATPSPDAPSYSLHAFDVAGDGYPVTIDTGLSKPDCDKLAELSNAQATDGYSYLFVCRDY